MAAIAAISWVRRGAAKDLPDKVEVTQEELAEIVSDVQAELREKGDTGELGPAPGEEDDNIDPDLAEYNLENYDDEDGELMTGAGIAGLTYYKTNEEDPYITLKADVDEDEEREDFEIRPTDNLIVVGITEEDHSRLDVYVWEEEEENAYVHHDIILSSFPLCLEWLDFESGTEEKGSFVAMGTMSPDIEIWDLDVIDPVEPVCILAGKKGKKARKNKVTTGASGHTDAVLGLSWNKPNRNLLASASADCTVKLWDLEKLTCLRTYNHHQDKVQSVEWNPAEPTVLLTGAFDKKACVFDTRAPEGVSSWRLTSDVEAMTWNAFEPTNFLVSGEDGNVWCIDARVTDKPVFMLSAHDKATSCLALSHHVPGLLVTGSADKSVKVWDIAGGKPEFVIGRELGHGAIYSLSFSPDAPFTVAVGGSKGKLKVYNIAENVGVAKRFESRYQSRLSQASSSG
eukprot:Colp12_sorted_trinity150504_noHs@36386